jgi:hypothetical protein
MADGPGVKKPDLGVKKPVPGSSWGRFIDRKIFFTCLPQKPGLYLFKSKVAFSKQEV